MKSEIRNPKSKAAANELPRRPARGLPCALLAFGLRPSGCLRIFASLAFLLAPRAAQACSVCFGSSDSQLSQGMLAGVLVLLLVVLSVLGGFVALFVFLARRAAVTAALDHQSSESKA